MKKYIAIAAAFVEPWVSVATYVGVAIVWLIPDKRMERYLASHEVAPG